MATTIRQVAAAAGVSVATASRALSGSDAVIEATRQRVLAVARGLDYTPSRLARSLVTGLTGNVGVILPDITNPFYTSFLAELESTLGAHDIGILIGDSQEDSDREYTLLQRMSTQVDGLVLASSRMSDDQIVGATSKLPIVLANRMLRGASPVPGRLSQVVIDVDPGYTAAVRHLHALGHTRVTYIDGPPRSWSGLQKRTALTRACAELGMPLTIVGTDRPGFGSGRDAAERIVDGSDGDDCPTAILAFNDQVALGVLAACRAAGIDVPGHISVAGCDDSLPDGLAWPALTTIDSSARTLGRLAAQAILNPTGERSESVQTRLVVRDSTARAHQPSTFHSTVPQPLQESS
jgi:LacI family transcriptional regulator